ncbi:MAG: LysM peptidoglycan-binding domain-containing protein [Trueperaceae bacterium]|nr:LysM peptidoglycan-binding domain-containing protein [Trueperaceae bacterium]
MCPRRFLLVVATILASGAVAESVTVRPGDTLWAIAQRNGTTVDALMAANGLSRPDLRPGETLALPGDDAPAPEIWTVSAGDTLYDIATATGTSVDELVAWNALNGATIRPGQELRLGPSNAAAELRPLTVEVRPGDSLWRIARSHDTTPAAIATANGIDASAVLQPGDRLVVPGVYAQADSPSDQGGFAAPTITVDPGDTLWEIARRYDTTVAALMEANALSDPALQAGQELEIIGADGIATSASPTATIPRPDPSPSQAAPTTMIWPLRGPVTSTFGWRALRIGGSNMHYGVDIDGVTGDPIVAASGGTVTYAAWMGGFGKLVIIEQGDTEYYYAHASEILVREGQQVETGQLIARVGTTGRVTGSHLHFEIRVDGTPVDPTPMLATRAGVR